MKRWWVTALTSASCEATKCHHQLLDRYIHRIMWDIYGETRPWGNPSRKDEAWWIFTHWKTYCPILPDCPIPLPLESTQKVYSYVLLKEHSLKVCPSLKISGRDKVSRPVEDWPQAHSFRKGSSSERGAESPGWEVSEDERIQWGWKDTHKLFLIKYLKAVWTL